MVANAQGKSNIFGRCRIKKQLLSAASYICHKSRWQLWWEGFKRKIFSKLRNALRTPKEKRTVLPEKKKKKACKKASFSVDRFPANLKTTSFFHWLANMNRGNNTDGWVQSQISLSLWWQDGFKDKDCSFEWSDFSTLISQSLSCRRNMIFFSLVKLKARFHRHK